MSDQTLPIILASGSPRRRELMTILGLRYQVRAADVDERAGAGETPAQMAGRLGRAKALAVAAGVPRGVIIAADTIVVLDGAILGKPASPDEARRMLLALRGRRHSVLTGVALARRPDDALFATLVETTVEMRPYTDAEIDAYIATGDPLDKAGAYAIQHDGFRPAAQIAGCYANVVGFPLCHIYRGLQQLGVEAACRPVAGCRAATGHPCRYYPTALDERE